MCLCSVFTSGLLSPWVALEGASDPEVFCLLIKSLGAQQHLKMHTGASYLS